MKLQKQMKKFVDLKKNLFEDFSSSPFEKTS